MSNQNSVHGSSTDQKLYENDQSQEHMEEEIPGTDQQFEHMYSPEKINEKLQERENVGLMIEKQEIQGNFSCFRTQKYLEIEDNEGIPEAPEEKEQDTSERTRNRIEKTQKNKKNTKKKNQNKQKSSKKKDKSLQQTKGKYEKVEYFSSDPVELIRNQYHYSYGRTEESKDRYVNTVAEEEEEYLPTEETPEEPIETKKSQPEGTP